MPATSYAKIVCTESSVNTALGTGGGYIFDSDHTNSSWTSAISSDIVWDSSAGTITFNSTGIYHVVANLVTETASGLCTHIIAFILNSTTVYGGYALVPPAYDPLTHAHQRIISVSAGDVLHVKGTASVSTFGVNAGSSLVINKITSGVYASSTVSTAGENNTTSEFNPLDIDGDGPAYGSAYKIASGITFSDTAGSFTVPSAGRYLIMVNNLIGATNSTNSNVTIHIKSGSDELYTIDTRNHSTLDAEETTVCLVEDLAAEAVLTMTWDTGSGDCHAGLGTTFTVYKLNEDLEDQPGGGNINSASICVVSKATSTATADEFNGFDEDNYSSADFDTRYSNGIAFTASTGNFTVPTKGLYWVLYSAQIKTASDATVSQRVKLNGSLTDAVAAVHLDTLNDPMNRSFCTIISCAAGDVITTTLDSNSPNITQEPGSSLTIIRIPDWVLLESAPAGLIGDDFVINSFSQDNLSAQHDRNIDQVPFTLGVPGPMSLRGRDGSVVVASLGKRSKLKN